jgi:hypothetical protein
MKREILQVIQMMKSNNVQPNQVNSTIKHILDYKEEGADIANLTQKRRGAVMLIGNNAANGAEDPQLRTSQNKSDSKSKGGNRPKSKEEGKKKNGGNNLMDTLHTDTASDEDKDLYQAPVTKMPYGFKKPLDESNNKSYTFDPQEVKIVPTKKQSSHQIHQDDVVQEATSEEENDSSNASSLNDRVRKRGRKNRGRKNNEANQELAVQAAEEMQDDIMWDITNQEIMTGFQENLALIAANSFEIL